MKKTFYSILKHFKTILTVVLLIFVQHLSFGQNGFTNKDEAKNETINGLKQGKWIEYADANNKLTTKENSVYCVFSVYKDDKLTEMQRGYFFEKLRFEIPYSNGKINGVCKNYNLNTGSLESETPYVEGKESGLIKQYYENGQVSIEYLIDTDTKIGEFRMYRTNGELLSVTPFLDGKIHGISKDYSEDGSLIRQRKYINGDIDPVFEKAELKRQKKIIKKEVLKSIVADLKNPDTWKNVASTVVLGFQQGVANDNMIKNPNAQTVSDYIQVVKNNTNLSPEDAMKANNKIISSTPTAESSASTNGGNASGTTSGKDGNSPEGKACSKRSKDEYEGSEEYRIMMRNRNDVTAPGIRNGLLAEAKYAEIILKNCRQYLNANEIAMLTSVMESKRKEANDGKGASYQH